MIEEDKKDIKHDNNKKISKLKRKSISGKVFLILTCFIILGIYFIIISKPAWIDQPPPSNILPAPHIDEIDNNSNKLPIKTDKIEEVNSENYLSENRKSASSEAISKILKAGEKIIKFAPEEEELSSEEVDNDNLNPYDKESEEVKNSAVSLELNENLLNNLNDYRIYLANTNELIENFYKDVSYSENLAIIVQMDLPKEIGEIVTMLEAYNTMLVDPTATTDLKQILPFNTDIFEKILKIRKETPEYNAKKTLKNKIENKIELFTNYIFSAEFQSEFLE